MKDEEQPIFLDIGGCSRKKLWLRFHRDFKTDRSGKFLFR